MAARNYYVLQEQAPAAKKLLHVLHRHSVFGRRDVVLPLYRSTSLQRLPCTHNRISTLARRNSCCTVRNIEFYSLDELVSFK